MLGVTKRPVSSITLITFRHIGALELSDVWPINAMKAIYVAIPWLKYLGNYYALVQKYLRASRAKDESERVYV